MLGAITNASGQSTWNYFISDAGGGNSLLTWNVTGDLTTGALLLISESNLPISITAPGIYADSYVPSGALQSIPTPDGSYFQFDGAQIYISIVAYSTANAPGNGNDNFALIAAPLHFPPPVPLRYNPGSQSALIPIDFTNFNPGTYQSQESGFSTPLTVNLTVGSVPEPAMLSFLALSGLTRLWRLQKSCSRRRESAQCTPDSNEMARTDVRGCEIH